MENLEKKERIELSIRKKFHKELFSKFAKAINEYDLIQPNDKIAVCISGGKDSMLLAKLFQELKRHNKFNFELVYLVMNPGYKKENSELIKENAELMDVPITTFESDIFSNVEHIEKSPCYICARMRRGFLYSKAKELGCNKIALGHHYDDVVETFMLNLFFEGRIGAFRPVTYLSRKDLTMIRPLIYTPEREIKSFSKGASLPIVEVKCPADGNTERARMKEYLAIFEKEHRGLYHRIMGAIQRGEIDGFHTDLIDNEEKKRRKDLKKELESENK